MLDVICHNGFTKEKVMLHSKDSYEFMTDANTTDVRCKVAYKVSYLETSRQILKVSLEFSPQREDEAVLLSSQHTVWRPDHQHGRQDWRGPEGKVSQAEVLEK